MPVDKKPIEIIGYNGGAHYPVVIQLRDGVVVLLFKDMSTRYMMGRIIRWEDDEVVLYPVQVLTKQNASHISAITLSDNCILVVFKDGNLIGYPRTMRIIEDSGVLYPFDPQTLRGQLTGLSNLCRDIQVCKLEDNQGAIVFNGPEKRNLYLNIFSYTSDSFVITTQGTYEELKVTQFEIGNLNGELSILYLDAKSRPYMKTWSPPLLEIIRDFYISPHVACDIALSKQLDGDLIYSISYNHGELEFGRAGDWFSGEEVNPTTPFVRKMRALNSQILISDYGQNIITFTDQDKDSRGRQIIFYNKIAWLTNAEKGPSNWKPTKNRSICHMKHIEEDSNYILTAFINAGRQNSVGLWVEPPIESIHIKRALLDEDWIPLEDENGEILLDEYIN